MIDQYETQVISKEEYETLKSDSAMLGIIGAYVEDFCEEEMTTLQGVIILLSKYHELKADYYYQRLEQKKENETH